MRLESLKLRNFRNFIELECASFLQVNMFIGKNAQGKSNILESINFALSGESFRGAKSSEILRRDGAVTNAVVEGSVSRLSSTDKIVCDFTNDNKQIQLNGKNSSKSKLRQKYFSVIFCPESLSIVKNGPAERRKFFDDFIDVISIEKAQIREEYVRCIASRNRVLRNALFGKMSHKEAREVLDSLQPIFLQLATKLVSARVETIKSITPKAQSIFKGIFKNPNVDISVDYVISQQSAIAWSANQVYDRLSARSDDLREAEQRVGQSLVGPHKHDVRFIVNGHDSRHYCSQGQQRAMILAYKIAQVLQYYEVYKEYPVLLLDDVFSELDSERRKSILEIFKEIPAQIFLTTTDIEERKDFDKKKRIKIFKVKDGIIE